MVPTGRFGLAAALLASPMPENVRVREKSWQHSVVTYRSSRGFSSNPAMAVVVQQMIAPEQADAALDEKARP